MERHQRDLGMLVVLVRITYQRGMIEKLVERFATVARVHGSVAQFAQVLDAREGFGSIFLFELFDVSGAIDQELEKLGSVCSRSRGAKALLRWTDRIIGSFCRCVGAGEVNVRLVK